MLGGLGIVLLVGVGLQLFAAQPHLTTVQPARTLPAEEDPKRAPAGRRDDDEPSAPGAQEIARSNARKRSVPPPAAREPAAPVRQAAVPAAAAAASSSQETAPDAGSLEAQRTLAALIAPFDLGSDVQALRARCAERHGMWLERAMPRCRMPGGRVYQFGMASGLLQTLLLRQSGSAPRPLLSGETLSSLQGLAQSGRGPWLVSVTAQQLTVQPRSHHPGL